MSIGFNPLSKNLEFCKPTKHLIPYTGATANVDLGVNNLTVDTNSLFVNSINHRVGIGTLVPTQALSVNGSQNITGTLGIGVGTPSARLHVHSSVAEDVLIVRANNTSQWKIDQYGTFTYSSGGLSFGYDPNILTNAHSSSGATYITSGLGSASAFNIILKPSGTGNVGIGTVTPGAKLEVNGAAIIGYSITGGTNISLNSGGPALTKNISIYYQSGTPSSSTTDYGVIQGAYLGSYYTNLALNPSGGNVGIGTTTPTAILHIKAGTTTLAPLKLTSGTNLTTVQDGAFEYNGTDLFFTVGGTRKTVTLV